MQILIKGCSYDHFLKLMEFDFNFNHIDYHNNNYLLLSNFNNDIRIFRDLILFDKNWNNKNINGLNFIQKIVTKNDCNKMKLILHLEFIPDNSEIKNLKRNMFFLLKNHINIKIFTDYKIFNEFKILDCNDIFLYL